jgi:uncharacterized protein (DUF1501 family)
VRKVFSVDLLLAVSAVRFSHLGAVVSLIAARNHRTRNPSSGGVTPKLFKLDNHVGLHPNMKAAKELFDDGRLCIVQGVGYPNPDRSHFRSMKIWQTARFDREEHDGYGWLGSALDLAAQRTNNNAAASAIYIGDTETPVALWGRRSAATALSSAEDLILSPGLKTKAAAVADMPGDSLRQFVSKQVLSAYAAADEFERKQTNRDADSGEEYPETQLGARLKLISQLIRGGAQSRVFYTIQGGYDTHSNQLYTHSNLLGEFAGALKALLNDLKAVNLDDRVVVLAFSEFGRRVTENDSQGTDHGTAGPVFLAGKPAKGGLVGSTPDLTNLDAGDLKMQFDFRQVYSTILDDWLGVDSKSVLGESFEKTAVLAV